MNNSKALTITIPIREARIPSDLWFMGNNIRQGDSFIHFNGYHVIMYTIGIENGEFKGFGRFINAKNNPRKITRSLKKILHVAKTKGHRLIFVNPSQHSGFEIFCQRSGFDIKLHGKERNPLDMKEKLLPEINRLYRDQINARKKQDKKCT